MEFGSSWGYNPFQLANSGYDVEGFELSRVRAEFGRKNLGIKIHTDWKSVQEDKVPRFDLIFTSHVFEHLTDPFATLSNLSEIVRPGGLMIVIVPNGAGRDLRASCISSIVGESHTLALTPTWFAKNLTSHGWKLEKICSSYSGGKISPDTDGDGLICVARRI